MLTPVETIALQWLCCAVALSFLLARLRVRARLRRSRLFWASDVLLALGLASAVGSSACDTLEFRMGAMSDFQSTSERLWKVRFAEKFLFDTGLYFPKMSLVLTYEKIVPRTSHRLRVFLKCIAAYVWAGCVVATAADALWCGTNISVNWTNPLRCSSFTSARLQRVTWGLNIVGELLLFLFPFFFLKSLRLAHFRERVGLALLLTLGMMTILVSTARFLFMTFLVNDISLALWTTAELSISVVVVSTTALGPLLLRLWHVVRAGFRGRRRRRRGRKTTTTTTTTATTATDPAAAKTQRDHHPHHHHRVFLSEEEEDAEDVLPRPTAAWHKWPVDLDVDSMCVTTTTTTATATTLTTSTGRSARGPAGRDALAGAAAVVSRGTQTLGRVVVELDVEGLPYGSRF